MAASRFNCSYLTALQESEFLINNGEPDWLLGVAHTPKKIQNLITITALMAHQPWLLTKDHIEPLVKGHDAWSISELVHAMLLVSTYVSLAGFLFGCGVTPEMDLEEDDLENDEKESSELGVVHSNPHNGGVTETAGGQDKNGGDCINTGESNESREGRTVKLMELLKKGIVEGESMDKAKDFANAGTDGTYFSIICSFFFIFLLFFLFLLFVNT